MEGTKNSKSLKLYNFYRSSASWRVRIVLHLKKLDFTYISINIDKGAGQQTTPEYEKINPIKHVPALEVDGNYIIESMAICEYLDETFPNIPLLPKDPIKKAQVRAFCEIINSGIQPFNNLQVLKKIEELNLNKNEWTKNWIEKGLDSLNKYLEGKTGKYCFGDDITLADVFLAPMIEGPAARFQIDISTFKNILKVIENLKDVSAFQKAIPKVQPDAE